MDCSNNNCSSCISDVLKRILLLQKQESDCDNYTGCDKPFLGPIIQNACYNTRPILLYNCCTGNTWSFDVTLDNGTIISSNVLRLESMDGCCCTCRVLNFTDGVYTSTNTFFTINLDCVSAIKCYADRTFTPREKGKTADVGYN